MTVTHRSSGITVTTQGGVETATLPPAKRDGKAGAKLTRGGSARADDSAAIVAEMQRHDLNLVDAVPLRLTPPVKRKGVKRGSGKPPSERASVTLDVALQDDENAVVLIEDQGEYRWVFPGQGTAPVKRGVKGGSTLGRHATFQIVLTAPEVMRRAANRRPVKRGWLKDALIGKATAFVFRFIARLVEKPLVAFLERNVTRGLVFIGAEDPAQWRLLPDRDPLPRSPPKDRRARVLLMIHGTFSSTLGSFGALGSFADGKDFLARALQSYDFVLGFDHPTLSVDPEVNATELLKRLRKLQWPQGLDIDIVAFSRAGLIARTLIENLLPGARWNAAIGRAVYVGCTNSGTQLAEPKNWANFIDGYTNMAVGATRVLSYIPGTQPWATIAGQAVQGVAAFVKALATAAVTDDMVPGLAAMEPEGPFVRKINQSRRGRPSAADSNYYAITTNFDPDSAVKNGTAGELAPGFLLRAANWAADGLYREPNDLVVNVSSMTKFDPDDGDFIKDKFDYGTNAVVYHTNYFAQSQTAKRMTQWLGLSPAVSSQMKRGVKRGGARVQRRRAPVVMPPVASGHSEALALIDTLASVDHEADRQPVAYDISAGVQTREWVAPSRPKKAARKRGPAKAKKKAAKRSATRMYAGHGARRATRKVAKKARRAMANQPIHVGPPLFDFTGGGTLGPDPRRAARLNFYDLSRRVGRKSFGAGGVGEAVPLPVKRKAPRKAARSPARAKCFFKAEMDGEIAVKKSVPVDVTISREILELLSGKQGGKVSAQVEIGQKVIVEVGDLRELKVDGERRFELNVPESGSPVTGQFKVIGERVGNAKLTVHFRQGSRPLATIQLAPRLVRKVTGASQRIESHGDVEALPIQDTPLDELRIYEQVNGNVVTYRFMLDLYSLRIRREYESKPLEESRDKYVQSIMNDIGKAWIADKPDAVESFERGIRAIGAQMFEQLIPSEMQRLLWTKRDSIKSVQVFSSEPFIPWELVYLKDPDVAGIPADNKFLGELGLLRWLYSSYPPARLRIRKGHALYLIGDAGADHSLPDAPAEGKLLRDTFGAKALSSNLNALERLLEQPDSFDLLHICCHGVAAGEDSAQAQLFINGEFDADGQFNGDALKAVTVEQTGNLAARDAENRPIVVLNACESARANREFSGLGGFAQAFVRAGAGAFVGSHWSIGDSPALKFVTAMYNAICQTKKKQMTLSEAVIAARKAARDDKDATWLAYVVYGHPRAYIAVG